ncbi:NADH-dependent oxidoreductase [Facklamia sp. 7083-14-GEN3]|uniref:oxidoreductase n=1 Tax=Facklamia sp. 7083-14-GEN3 TaxID=2973478 RepID=UPI00215C1B09|nr:NADH-dependent oxidoreductase [Facklamia sp. 7083-14-GEN3]MCR8968876.1 NADH-dependent oxidoreductase [Facklamia sp. 7083-14-GEN3]
MKKLTDSIRLRHGAQLTNRIVQPPMKTFSGLKKGFNSQETLDYYQRRSQSAAMIIAEYHYVSPEGGPANRLGSPEQLAAFSDDYLPGLKELAKRIKSKGNKAILQIHHSGYQAHQRASEGLPVYGVSAVDLDFLDHEIVPLSIEQIKQIVKDFGQATKRAIKAGFDGVEIHGANHYLIQQFFSKNTNYRKDQYGGSLENRMRFALEVTDEVTRVAKDFGPEDFIVGYRISPEEIHGQDIGYNAEEARELVAALQPYELDYLHLSLWGSYDSKPKDSQQTFSEIFQPVLDEETLLVLVGGVFDADSAQRALDYTDLVAIGRGTLIEPDFALKISQGRPEFINSHISKEILTDLAWPTGLYEAFTSPRSTLPPIPGMQEMLKELQ